MIINNLKSIRKSERRSEADCAVVLGISEDAYHLIERGERSLTLPELELLALFLNAKIDTFLEDNLTSQPKQALFSNKIRAHYKTLRDKMIRARLAMIRENEEISLEELANSAQIPLNHLRNYCQENSFIPLNDLVKISETLGIPLETLSELPIDSANKQETTLVLDQDAGVTEVESQEKETRDDPFEDILAAFRTIHIQDQAIIAKTILETLKSQITGES